MKNKNLLGLLILSLIPTITYASTNFDPSLILGAVLLETFVTLHMTAFVIKPLSVIFDRDGSKNLFKKLFYGRIIILLIFDIFIPPKIMFIDFISVFIGAFILVPISSLISKKIPINSTISTIKTKAFDRNICEYCSNPFEENDKYCQNCGKERFHDVEKDAFADDYDKMLLLTDEAALETLINKKISKLKIEKDKTPQILVRKKIIINTLFSLLTFIYICSIFFHFPLATYILGLLFLIFFNIFGRRCSVISYLKKEIKSRPQELIDNILMKINQEMIVDNSRKIFAITIILSIALPLIIFSKPRIMYEKVDDGYAVRFYTFGLFNFTTAEIPESHNGLKVKELRGNSFSNMPLLKEVTLPNTITRIRGQAFKNDLSLYKINLPNKLEYLGGGSFYNCKSLVYIELPDSLTYMGGETFYNASKLENIVLSNKLQEIRGNTFEYCSSLKEIFIPDSVTRIGAHAFYENISLSEVQISSNSSLTKIGSSAFRKCNKLYNITLPRTTLVDKRAFKESPTTISYFENISYYN